MSYFLVIVKVTHDTGTDTLQNMIRNKLVDGINTYGEVVLGRMCCYESPREERVSHAFTHLISNIKTYNGVKI